jgi:hypothetical protein
VKLYKARHLVEMPVAQQPNLLKVASHPLATRNRFIAINIQRSPEADRLGNHNAIQFGDGDDLPSMGAVPADISFAGLDRLFDHHRRFGQILEGADGRQWQRGDQFLIVLLQNGWASCAFSKTPRPPSSLRTMWST